MDKDYNIYKMQVKNISNNIHTQYENVHICINNKPNCVEHIHDCYEIEIVINGNLSEFINGKEYKAKAGDVFLLCPNDIHRLSYDNGSILSIFNIMFSKEIFKENFFVDKSILNIESYELSYTELNQEDFVRISSNLKNSINEYKYYDDNISMAIIRNSIELVLLTVFRYHAVDCIKKYDNRIMNAIKYVEKNYSTNITISDVAHMVGLTKNYFARLFLQSTGTQFNDFVSNYRLSQIQLRLIESNDSIIDICYENGYSSLSTFYRDFKNYCKLTPMQYRKKHLK